MGSPFSSRSPGPLRSLQAGSVVGCTALQLLSKTADEPDLPVPDSTGTLWHPPVIDRFVEWLITHLSVDVLAHQIKMTCMSGSLLQHVDDDPTKG